MNYTSVLTFPVSIIRGLALKIRFNLKVFWILSVILMFSLAAFYIFQVNSSANESYSIKEDQKKLDVILKELEGLKIDLTKLIVKEDFENIAEDFGFEKIGEVRYIYIQDTRMVTK